MEHHNFNATLTPLVFGVLFLLYYLFGIMLISYRSLILKNNHTKELWAKINQQEETLKNISQEIHDNIGQSLSVINLKMDTFHLLDQESQEKLAECKMLLKKTIQDLRDVIRTLDTDHIKDTGLRASVENQLLQLERINLYKVNFYLFGEAYDLDPEIELFIFRVVQELLNNIIKHAKPNSIQFKMLYSSDGLDIIIEDDGKGFDINAAKRGRSRGCGIRNMERRMSVIGGQIEIQSELNKGTVVKLKIPNTRYRENKSRFFELVPQFISK